MAFGDIVKINPSTYSGSEAGVVATKLNQLFQQEGKDIKINLTTDGNDYMRYNSTTSRFEWYIDGTIQGYLDATEFKAV